MNPVIERVFDAIVRIDHLFNIKFISDIGLRWFGGTNPAISKSFIDLVIEDDRKILYNNVKNLPASFSCYVRLVTDKNVIKAASLRATLMPVINQYLICILDINDYKSDDASLVYAAEHDFLTALPNRAKLTKVVEDLIHSGKMSFSIALLDLDGFKKVNDTLGHSAGDDILIETSARLLKSIHKTRDMVARLGGDEFVLVLDNGLDSERINSIMSRVLYLIARPFITNEQDAYLGCSIGLANYPEHGESYTDLLKNADTAMYQSKRSGKNRVSTYVHALETEDFSIKSAMHIGIQEGEFYIKYQPQYNKNREIKGVEALMRWKSSTLGEVSPEQFIPVAEETGLMVYLGEWILRSACYQLKQFQKINPNFVISVNVSPVQFASEDFYDTVVTVLEESNVEAKNILLEITESSLLKNHETVEKILNNLNKKGVKLAIDDFGTGFSSLSYLTKFPVDFIKIDKSFIKDIETQPENVDTVEKKLIKAMIGLAHSIDLICVAEGVEVASQFKYLSSVGCDYMQGYHLGKPLSANEITALLKGDI